jgi:hypothetical protein
MSKSAGGGGGGGGGMAAVTNTAQLEIAPSGMRPESLEQVRAQRDAGQTMRPIEVSVYPGERPFLQDGRHRLQVAQERGDKTIEARIRYYGARGGLRQTVSRRVKVSPP